MSPEVAHEAVRPFLPLRQALARAAFQDLYRIKRANCNAFIEPMHRPTDWPVRWQVERCFAMRDDRRQPKPDLQARLFFYKFEKYSLVT